MTNGDYVFLYYDLVPPDWLLRPWEIDLPEGITDEEYEERQKAFYPFKIVSTVIHSQLYTLLTNYCCDDVWVTKL